MIALCETCNILHMFETAKHHWLLWNMISGYRNHRYMLHMKTEKSILSQHYSGCERYSLIDTIIYYNAFALSAVASISQYVFWQTTISTWWLLRRSRVNIQKWKQKGKALVSASRVSHRGIYTYFYHSQVSSFFHFHITLKKIQCKKYISIQQSIIL